MATAFSPWVGGDGSMGDIVHQLLRHIALVWIAVWFLDWICHLRSRIETTSGLQESVHHVLQLGLVGVGVALAFILRPSLPLVFVLSVLWAMHEWLAWRALEISQGQRAILPVEHLLHSFKDILPLCAICLVAVLVGDEVPRAPLKRDLPAAAMDGRLLATCLAFLAFVFIPYMEELARCLFAQEGLDDDGRGGP